MTNLILPSRRGFLAGIGAALAAPAIVRIDNIMPVRAIKLVEHWPPVYYVAAMFDYRDGVAPCATLSPAGTADYFLNRANLSWPVRLSNLRPIGDVEIAVGGLVTIAPTPTETVCWR